MQRILFVFLIVFWGCVGYQSKSEKLSLAVRELNTLLKFKDYGEASSKYVVPFYRKDFLDNFQNTRLFMEDFEVYRIKPLNKEKERMEVVLNVLFRPKNSTIIKRLKLIEHWVYLNGKWFLSYLYVKK